MPPDRFTPAIRSAMMSRIQGKNTTPELTIRKRLWKKGLRYRLHPQVFGRPDFAFIHARVAVFIDGCFWHGCPEHYQAPKSNKAFWKKKLTANRARDAVVSETLSAMGWLCLRFWEHDVEDRPDRCANSILRAVRLRRVPHR
jgi:DNA mismatch endonuclease (patch repair protein)